MTARRPRTVGTDATAIARASRVVTAQITIAAAGIVLLVVVAAVVFLVNQSQPRELLEKPEPGQTKIYVDADQMLAALLVVGVLAILVAALLSWVIARRAVRPLGEALRIQRTFVADASHELRTPVAVVAARIEVLKQEINAHADTAESLAELQHDVRMLGDVITDLLLAAAPPPQPEAVTTIPVAAVVADTLADLQILADEHDITLRLTVDAESSTTVPQTTLRRCIVALVDNAIRHSPPDGVVDVTVANGRNRSLFAISVQDHGSGIAGVNPDRVFDRFAHGGTTAADGSRAGFGIGLSLVRDIADRYDGRIEIVDTSGAGTTFRLSLPRT